MSAEAAPRAPAPTPTPHEAYRLIASPSSGATIVEALFVLSGLAYTVEEVDYEAPGPGRDRLRAVNPLGQVPALLLPDGMVLTESAAIALHLADRVPEAGLVPSAEDPTRPAFLRWLVFLVASLYPTWTYGDFPDRWVPGEAAGAELRASSDAYRQRLWQVVEREIAPAPWFLGERFSVLDVYVSVMTRWRPRRAWFAEHCPKLHGIALAVDARPELAEVWARNFGEQA